LPELWVIRHLFLLLLLPILFRHLAYLLRVRALRTRILTLPVYSASTTDRDVVWLGVGIASGYATCCARLDNKRSGGRGNCDTR
jgi:hypothetical protein